MILLSLIVIPVVGGLLALLLGRWTSRGSRAAALLAMAVDLAVALGIGVRYFGQLTIATDGPWLVALDWPWIPQFGIDFHLGLDGLSLILVLLTAVLGIVAVVASWTEVQDHVGLFHFNLLWVLAATSGVFLALDLFLFYFAWEMMLIPMFFLIAVWGQERRVAAAVRFFVFTQVGGLLMLVALVGLYLVHGSSSGTYTFDYLKLVGTAVPPSLATWLMLGFLAAFAVKVPLFPFQSWLPDAYVEAPTAGSVVLSGLLAKTGVYGILRFAIPLFPDAAAGIAPVVMALAVVGILYGAVLAFGQTDAKRLLAYASFSHLGLIVLGVFAWTQLALQGVVLQIVAHGITLAALFLLVGAIEERIHTRDLGALPGLWSEVPRIGGFTLFFALALMGLPGLGTFVGEFLVLLGTFASRAPFAIVAALGMIAAVIYALWLVQRLLFGPREAARIVPELAPRETATLAVLIVLIVGLGLYPQPVFTAADGSIRALQQAAVGMPAGLARVGGGIVSAAPPSPDAGGRR
jgi:NADH-quinone oxidoreductase subunit M